MYSTFLQFVSFFKNLIFQADARWVKTLCLKACFLMSLFLFFCVCVCICEICILCYHHTVTTHMHIRIHWHTYACTCTQHHTHALTHLPVLVEVIMAEWRHCIQFVYGDLLLKCWNWNYLFWGCLCVSMLTLMVKCLLSLWQMSLCSYLSRAIEKNINLQRKQCIQA